MRYLSNSTYLITLEEDRAILNSQSRAIYSRFLFYERKWNGMGWDRRCEYVDKGDPILLKGRKRIEKKKRRENRQMDMGILAER